MGLSELSARVSVMERSLLSLKVLTDEHIALAHQIERKMGNMQTEFARLVTRVKNQEESIDLMLDIVKLTSSTSQQALKSLNGKKKLTGRRHENLPSPQTRGEDRHGLFAESPMHFLFIRPIF